MTSEQEKLNVLLISEGSYPFYGGGISTWSHMLCERITNVNYHLYSINAGFENKPIFELGPNVKDVIQVPLWAPDEPQDYVSFNRDYYKVVNRKENTTDAIVEKYFLDHFKTFLDLTYSETKDVNALDTVFHAMWSYFQTYDYKKTMRSELVWNAFREKAISETEKDGSFNASIFDMTVGMRWLYRFFIPFSISIPKMDLTHITLSGFPLIPALSLKYRYNTPIIITEHGVYVRERLLYINRSDYSYFIKVFLIKLTEAVTRLSYYKADKILSVNKFNMEWEKMYGADHSKLEITYNGVNDKLYIPREKPDRLKGIPTVVAMARIFELKDILTMIKTAQLVKDQIPNVQFLIYGDKQAVPEYTAQCEALIKSLSLENIFFLKGHRDKPHEVYSEGDISILTSISEGFPFTVLESMSCEVPVVATDVGGVAEAISEETGFVCKPRSPKDIADKVVLLLKHDALRKKMGIAGRKRVSELFTIEKFITSYEKIYEQVFSDFSPKVSSNISSDF